MCREEKIISTSEQGCEKSCLILLFKKIQKQPPEVQMQSKGVLKNFANFAGKHLCWSLIFMKLQAFSLQVF